MGRKIEFFIDNDNGNVKIKDYLKHRGVSHRMLCVLKRTENGILKNINSLRAAVCPAMIKVPRLLMPYCSTTDPAATMLPMKPIDRP